MKKVQIIVASNGKNLDMAQDIKNEIVAQGGDGEILDLVALDLPLYSANRELSEDKKNMICNTIKSFKSVNHFFVVAPEYNGGMPPVLTNFIAWVSVSTADWREAFNGKSAALATYSGGAGANLMTAMRLQLSYVGLNTIGRSLSACASSPMNRDSLKSIVEQLIKYS